VQFEKFAALILVWGTEFAQIVSMYSCIDDAGCGNEHVVESTQRVLANHSILVRRHGHAKRVARTQCGMAGPKVHHCL
jgi:hypothetical protein